MIGWFANVFIVIGLWRIGYKDRSAFLWTIVGEVIWTGYAAYIGMHSLSFICAVFAALAVRNYRKWGEA